MADRTSPWQRLGGVPASRQPPENRADPIYDALRRRWNAQGRTVPGRPDPEWRRLVERDPWSRDRDE
ncbi:hypothetical protein AB0I16_06430 [Streptomyces sp. NPDC050703]|uniref:hypothetical protein n=1 Tax=Streptomyces sp. NPDC050703 TaxID=3157218 RepID=UPI0034377E7E